MRWSTMDMACGSSHAAAEQCYRPRVSREKGRIVDLVIRVEFHVVEGGGFEAVCPLGIARDAERSTHQAPASSRGRGVAGWGLQARSAMRGAREGAASD